MKLAIYTQIRENYGAHDWDGEGECPQYWKAKGGHVYVVRDITPEQAIRIGEFGIPKIKSLIEERNDAFEEFIINYSLLDNDDTECESWESPTQLIYAGGKWTALEVRENNEYGYMRHEIERAISTWDLEPNGVRKNYTTTYVMRGNGDVVKDSDIREYLNNL